MSSFALKLIAIITMTIDHVGAVFQSHVWEYRELGFNMRVVGRIAFPLFCFLIAEGMRKTRNRPMYLLRLGVFAVISMVPFSLFTTTIMGGQFGTVSYFDFTRTNVLITLGLGALSIFLFDAVRGLLRKFLKGIPGHVLGFAAPFVCGWAARALNTDYGRDGVLLIFAIYWIMNLDEFGFLQKIPSYVWRYVCTLPMFYWAHRTYSYGLFPVWVPFIRTYGYSAYAFFAAIAPLLVLVYDGTLGSAKLSGGLKIWFYAYYPAHMMVIYLWSLTI